MNRRLVKVLFIAEIASPHAARWIHLTVGAEVQSAVFQATCGPTEMCEDLRSYLGAVYTPKPITGLRNQKSLFSEARPLDTLVEREGVYPQLYADFLLKAVEEFKPDFIHVLGLCVNFRNSTRVLMRAKAALGNRCPPIMYSSWGADLDYFPKQEPTEVPYIEEFLRDTDFHITECQRDVRLAREMGFRGRVLATLPANGGMEDSLLEEAKKRGDGDREWILLKGRDQKDGDPIGRAMEALEALERASADLGKFKIGLLQASKTIHVKKRAEELARRTGLEVYVLPYISTAELYEKLLRSYLFIANTINDGLPLSLVEAMTLGAVPIHSDLESIRDYVVSGENGFLVAWDDVDGMAKKLREAARNPIWVEKARRRNFALVKKRLLRSVVRRKMTKAYAIAGGSRAAWARRHRVSIVMWNAAVDDLKTSSYESARSVFRLLPNSWRTTIRKALFK